MFSFKFLVFILLAKVQIYSVNYYLEFLHFPLLLPYFLFLPFLQSYTFKISFFLTFASLYLFTFSRILLKYFPNALVLAIPQFVNHFRQLFKFELYFRCYLESSIIFIVACKLYLDLQFLLSQCKPKLNLCLHLNSYKILFDLNMVSQNLLYIIRFQLYI